METVKINKHILLGIVRKNRDSHKNKVNKAFDKYREMAIVELDEIIAEAKSGKKIRRMISLFEPMDMTESYDTIIKMLEMSVDETIELSFNDFQQYVEDKWGWSEQFTVSNSMYLGR